MNESRKWSNYFKKILRSTSHWCSSSGWSTSTWLISRSRFEKFPINWHLDTFACHIKYLSFVLQSDAISATGSTLIIAAELFRVLLLSDTCSRLRIGKIRWMYVEIKTFWQVHNASRWYYYESRKYKSLWGRRGWEKGQLLSSHLPILLLFPDVDLEAEALLTDLSLRLFHRGSKLGHLFLEHHLHILGDTCAVYTDC